MTTYPMQDSVTAANLDPDIPFACFYADGAYANGTAVKARCPKAAYLGITVLGGDADCCDSETGDLTVPGTIAWVERRVAAGAKVIVVYANESRWKNEGLEAALAKYGDRLFRWMALYDNNPTIPAGYDAKQYADPGPIDRSVINQRLADALRGTSPAPKPKPAKYARGTATFTGSVNLTTGQWKIHGLPGSARWGVDEREFLAQVRVTDGKWSIVGLPRDTKPLG